CIRLCSCGQFYAYNGNRWKPMSQFHLWLRRKDLADDIGWLFNEARPREWHAQAVSSWRGVGVAAQWPGPADPGCVAVARAGRDAANPVSRGPTWPGHEL